MTDYIWYYSAVSFLFLSVTAVYYHMQRRIPDMADYLYSRMLISCTIAAFFEAFSTVIMPYALKWPVWSLYLFHMIFLISLQICLPSCVLYFRALAGVLPQQGLQWRSPLMIPFYAVSSLVAISPFCRYGVFYISESHDYCYGATHAALFISTGIYFALGFWTMLRNREKLAKKDSAVLIALCTLIILIIAIQIVYPAYLMTVLVVGLAITAVFHSMQSQSNYVDATTDVFDRFAMDKLMSYEYSRQRDFAVVLYSLENFSLAEHTLGSEAGTVLLRDFAQYLTARYPRQSVIRMSTAKFAVLVSYARAATPDIPPRVWTAGGTQISLTVSIAVARGADFPRREDMAAVLDYLMETQQSGQSVVFADEAMLHLAKRAGEAASALGRQLFDGGLAIGFRPLYHAGRVWAQEVLPASDDLALYGMGSAELMSIAMESGNAAHLGAALLRGGCEYLRAVGDSPDAPERIAVFMPLALYMREGISGRIAAVVAEYGIAPERVCFQIGEYLPDGELAAARENISELVELGFGVLLEHFGAGSAGFNTLTNLSNVCVRMDTGLLEKADRDAVCSRMLDAIYSMLEELHVPVIYTTAQTR